MFVEMSTKKDRTDTEPPIPEICEFKGIKWNSIGFVTIYTNHSRHVYMMPLEQDEYVEFEKQIRMAYVKNASLISIEGDIYRIPRDSFQLTKEKSSAWKINVVATAGVGGAPQTPATNSSLIKEL